MRGIPILVFTVLMVLTTSAFAADRAKSQGQIDAAQADFNVFKKKAGDNSVAAAELDAAARHIEAATVALKIGEKMFGGLTDEAETDIRHALTLFELTQKLAAAKIERAKIEVESAALRKRIETTKSRVKVFDDLRAEIARLKGELASLQSAAKDIGVLMAEKGALEAQVAKLTSENKQISTLKSENAASERSVKQLKEENTRPERQAESVPPEAAGMTVRAKEVAADSK